jgi:hypothetical protein
VRWRGWRDAGAAAGRRHAPDLRLFLGYGLGERLPTHQTISEAHTQRFADGDVFERLFLRTVALCKEQGLIEGSHLSVDGFHAEANAALRSLRASLEPIASGEAPAKDEPERDAPPEPPRLRLAEPRSGPTPKRKATNQTVVSTTDRDARLKSKPGQRPHLVYRGHVAVDPKARCGASCLCERAEGHEGDALAPILDRARFALPELASVGADQGFAAERVWQDAAERTIVAHIPPQKTMLPRDGREPRTNAQRLALAKDARVSHQGPVGAPIPQHPLCRGRRGRTCSGTSRRYHAGGCNGPLASGSFRG